MVGDDEYELMPHKAVKKLQKQIDNVNAKTKDLEALSTPEMKKAMYEMTNSMNSLIEMFKVASDSMKMEEHDQDIVVNKINPIMKKLEQIEKQNEEIAQGIVTVAEMLKQRHRPMPRPVQRPTPRPAPRHAPAPMPHRAPAPAMMPSHAPPPPPGFGPKPPGPMPPPPGLGSAPKPSMPPPPPMGGLGDLPDLDLEEKTHKKGFLGLFKKK